jgi:hypothetical protein
MKTTGMYRVTREGSALKSTRDRVLCPMHAREPLSDGWAWVNDPDCSWDGECREECDYCKDVN